MGEYEAYCYCPYVIWVSTRLTFTALRGLLLLPLRHMGEYEAYFYCPYEAYCYCPYEAYCYCPYVTWASTRPTVTALTGLTVTPPTSLHAQLVTPTHGRLAAVDLQLDRLLATSNHTHRLPVPRGPVGLA